MELNKIWCMDNVQGMIEKVDDNSIDLTVTSPPYDKLRKYKGYSWDFEGVVKQLFRCTKDGGVVVWVVNDATMNGSETLTSFKQALYFQAIGFNVHDTMIWYKENAMPQVDKSRYTQSFEYMFIFSKGKPKTANILEIETKNAGKRITRISNNEQNINKSIRVDKTKKTRLNFNVWKIFVGSKSNGHPAIFPEKLAEDHILSWSKPNDIVLDPFFGSGTTGKMAKLNNRNYIGFDSSREYCDIAEKRCK